MPSGSRCGRGRDPELLAEADLRAFFLHLKSLGLYAPGTVRLITAALRFLFIAVLGRSDWKVLSLIRTPEPLRLPSALSPEELRRLFATLRTGHMRLLVALMYGCGLRVSEAVRLEVSDVRGRGEPMQRLLVRGGKGDKDRLVPLPPTLYNQLRDHWRTHRHPRWLFPCRDGSSHVSISALQQCMAKARLAAGLRAGISCHSLRHSYATHALDGGVNLKQLSLYMGHHDIRVTAIYLHLSTLNEARAVQAIEAFSAPLFTL
jgi:integrase/recombinase XerD